MEANSTDKIAKRCKNIMLGGKTIEFPVSIWSCLMDGSMNRAII